MVGEKRRRGVGLYQELIRTVQLKLKGRMLCIRPLYFMPNSHVGHVRFPFSEKFVFFLLGTLEIPSDRGRNVRGSAEASGRGRLRSLSVRPRSLRYAEIRARSVSRSACSKCSSTQEKYPQKIKIFYASAKYQTPGDRK